MDINKIKELVEILENSDLNTLEVVDKDGSSVFLEKGTGATIPVLQNTAAVSNGNMQTSAASMQEGVNIQEEKTDHEGTPVDSPMVGVFYSKPSPDDEPYVSIGTQVKKGQTLCIIEAMKLMNEIPAEKDGVIAEICVKDGDLIEYGQTLFYIK